MHCLANEKSMQEVSTKQEDLEENEGAVIERGRQRCIFLDLIVRKVVALGTKHLFHEYQSLKMPFFLQMYGLLQATFGDNWDEIRYTAHRPGRLKPRGHKQREGKDLMSDGRNLFSFTFAHLHTATFFTDSWWFRFQLRIQQEFHCKMLQPSWKQKEKHLKQVTSCKSRECK